MEEAGGYCRNCMAAQTRDRLAEPDLVRELSDVSLMLTSVPLGWGFGAGMEGVALLRRFGEFLGLMSRYLNFFFIQADPAQQLNWFHNVWARIYDLLTYQLVAEEENIQRLALRVGLDGYHPPTYQRNPTPIPPNIGGDNRYRCSVCMVNEADHVSRSCGHTFCQACIYRLSTCAVCRRPICGRLRIYFSG